MANGKWRIKSLDAVLAAAEKKSLHRSLGPIQLTLLGIGGIIGTGIFVLTAEAAQKAGPGMMMSFVIAGAVSAVAALCYAELAAMVPVSGSAYTYSYAVLGELVAWLVGWALILEYAVAASAVSVGWSGYIVGLLAHLPHPIIIPQAFAAGPYAGGAVNLLAVFVALVITVLLVIGTRESATVNAVLVAIKLVALGAFILLALPVMHSANFHPFAPLGTNGIISAAASIFFAYVGFDAVSTAAEETRDPQRNLPIGLIGSLAVCTVIYLLVAAGAIGSYGAQPVFTPMGENLEPGSMALQARCAGLAAQPLVCSKEALAHVLRSIHHPFVGNLLGLAAGVALPTVILMMIYGQTRIFFCDVARRIAAGRAEQSASPFPHPACGDLDHRRRGRLCRRLPARGTAGRYFQCRHPVRVRRGIAGRDGAAPHPARAQAAFPNPRRPSVRHIVGLGLHRAVRLPALAGQTALSHLVACGSGVLLRLRLSPQPCRQGSP